MTRRATRTLLAAAVAGAAPSLASSAAADQTYTDATGDGQGGPDITSVSVSQAAGLVQFLVTTKDALTASQAVAILVDADGNESTGFQGAEYAMYAGAPVPFVTAADWARVGIATESAGHFAMLVSADSSVLAESTNMRFTPLSRSRLVIGGAHDCGKKKGINGWSVTADRLTLTKLQDACASSSGLFNGVWTREKT